MKILKSILIALGVIVLIAAIGIYFLPAHYQISNSIEIDKPADVVFANVADFEKWKSWGPWIEMEPTAKLTVEGEPGTPGHKMTWDGEKLGVGSATIADVTNKEAIATDLDFQKPMKSSAKDYWKFEDLGGKTKATWISSGDLSYPMGRVFGLYIDKMVGEKERHGLDNLKKLCESQPTPVASVDTPADTTAISQ
jgi:hypothetical protein